MAELQVSTVAPRVSTSTFAKRRRVSPPTCNLLPATATTRRAVRATATAAFDQEGQEKVNEAAVTELAEAAMAP